jgi:plasmid maintenance system antidote protein VapI
MADSLKFLSVAVDTLGVSHQTINEILRERRALSPAMALRLSRLFGNSPEFWLNASVLWTYGRRSRQRFSAQAWTNPDRIQIT